MLVWCIGESLVASRIVIRMDYFIHLANIIYLASYWCKDARKLRLLTCLGILLLIPYYLVQVEPLYAAALWNLFFLAVNLWRLKKDKTLTAEPV